MPRCWAYVRAEGEGGYREYDCERRPKKGEIRSEARGRGQATPRSGAYSGQVKVKPQRSQVGEEARKEGGHARLRGLRRLRYDGEDADEVDGEAEGTAGAAKEATSVEARGTKDRSSIQRCEAQEAAKDI